MMKIILYISLIIFLLSCDRQIDRVNRKYILENGTNRDIKIEFYFFERLSDTYQKTGLGVIYEGLSSNDTGKGISAGDALNADSIIVTFDDQKRQIYTNIKKQDRINISPAERNIFIDSVYTIENNELYRFTFTEEDYENAEIID